MCDLYIEYKWGYEQNKLNRIIIATMQWKIVLERCKINHGRHNLSDEYERRISQEAV